MLLKDKTAVVYGGGGAIGGATARAFAREGARIHLAGRTAATLEVVAREIVADGGAAEVALVDALDQAAVREHADRVAKEAGSIDVALNAIGIPHVQGIPFTDLALDDFLHPIAAYCRSNFITAQAVARHMDAQGSGVILTISTSGSRLAVAGTAGYSATCAAIEAMTRVLAAELGPRRHPRGLPDARRDSGRGEGGLAQPWQLPAVGRAAGIVRGRIPGIAG